MTETDLRRRSSSCRSRSAGLLACSSSSRKEEREAAGREGGGGAGNRKGALEERELPKACLAQLPQQMQPILISSAWTLKHPGRPINRDWTTINRTSRFLDGLAWTEALDDTAGPSRTINRD